MSETVRSLRDSWAECEESTLVNRRQATLLKGIDEMCGGVWPAGTYRCCEGLGLGARARAGQSRRQREVLVRHARPSTVATSPCTSTHSSRASFGVRQAKKKKLAHQTARTQSLLSAAEGACASALAAEACPPHPTPSPRPGGRPTSAVRALCRASNRRARQPRRRGGAPCDVRLPVLSAVRSRLNK